jgi:Fe-S-cluster containining protein
MQNLRYFLTGIPVKGYALFMANEMESLLNYRNLVAKVDELCGRIIREYGDSISCHKGCDGCCRHISLFPVEAAALAAALRGIPPEKSAQIRKLARAASPEACPLLENGCCLLYAFRPIICRTHGLPLITGREGEKVIDFCPKNFGDITSFPAADVLNLELLNSTLAVINRVFTASCDVSPLPGKDRLSIAEALLLDL